MLNEPFWLPIGLIIDINKQEVAASTEPYFLRDRGLLASAIARPQQHWAFGGVTDIVVLATALLFGIARNHPFEQGNKRTGFIAAKTFIEANGHVLHLDDDTSFASLIVDVIEDVSSEEHFSLLLSRSVEPIVDV